MTEENLELSLTNTLKESDLSELGAVVSDTALEAAGNLPIVGCLHKLWTTAKCVPTYLFMKKIYRFLFELKDVPVEKRRQQIAKMEVLTEERENVGESVLLLLDKLNDMKKPAMMGKAFKAYLEERITFDDLQSLNYAIDQLNCANRPCLIKVYNRCEEKHDAIMEMLDSRVQEEEFGISKLQHLATCGLLDIYFTPSTSWNLLKMEDKSTGGYIPNSIGRIFVEIIFDQYCPIER